MYKDFRVCMYPRFVDVNSCGDVVIFIRFMFNELFSDRLTNKISKSKE